MSFSFPIWCLGQDVVISCVNSLSTGEGTWSGGAMVLGKRPVPGRLTNLDNIRARAYCTCSKCGWGLFGRFVSRLSFLSSVSLSPGDDPI